MLTKVGGFAFKEEASAGTAETITSSEMILAREPKITPDMGMQERNVVRQVADPLTPIKGGVNCGVTAILELKGSGTAGTAPTGIGDALESCGFDESVDSGVKVTYTLRANPRGGKSGTAKSFLDGKYVTARGVRGNPTLTFKAGEVCTLAYDGKGALEARGDASVLTSPSDSPKPPIFQSADMWLLEHHAILNEDLDGAIEKLLDGAASNVKMAITVTQGSTTQKLKKIRLPLAKVGTPANETDGVWLTIEGDATGDPNGTPITNGTSAKIATANISATQTWVDFNFATPPTLTASTVYHIVLQGDYDADATNCISVDTDVCIAGAQICQFFDAAWAALALKNISCQILVAVDPTIYFDGMEINPNNEVVIQKDPNYAEGIIYGEITGRNVTIALEPLEKTDALTDFVAYLSDKTDLYLQAQLGSAAGNIIEVIAQHVTVKKAGEWGDRDGQVTHPIELHLEDGTDLELRIR